MHKHMTHDAHIKNGPDHGGDNAIGCPVANSYEICPKIPQNIYKIHKYNKTVTHFQFRSFG